MKPNEHGAFTDPERIEIFRKKSAYAMVLLVCVDGRFHWGYDLRDTTGGCSGLSSLKRWRNTRNEAILSALKVLAKWNAQSKAMAQEIERRIESLTPKQLDLFEMYVDAAA